MTKSNKITCFSLNYNANGHSKDYLDSFFEQLKNDLEISVLCYGKPKINSLPIIYCNGDISDLNYKSDQFMSSHRKIFRRFFASFKLYFHSLRFNDIKNSQLYFLDYEYLSLAIFLTFFFRKQNKYILIHSVDSSGSRFKKIYKNYFFKIISKVSKVTYVVNGEDAFEQMKTDGFEYVKLIQYPTELKVDPLTNEKAKSILGLNGKVIFSLIGMIRADKNYAETIEAFSKSVLSNCQHNHLLVAGYPSNITASEISDCFTINNIKNYTFLPKYLSDDELNIVFSASDFLLVPYGSGGTSQSGPLSQARLYHLPAIAQANGEIGNYVVREKVGLTFDSFCNLVEILNNISNANLASDFSSVNIKYSWEQARLYYLDIFNK